MQRSPVRRSPRIQPEEPERTARSAVKTTSSQPNATTTVAASSTTASQPSATTTIAVSPTATTATTNNRQPAGAYKISEQLRTQPTGAILKCAVNSAITSANVASASVEPTNVNSANVTAANVASVSVEPTHVNSANVASASFELMSATAANAASASDDPMHVMSANAASAGHNPTNAAYVNAAACPTAVGANHEKLQQQILYLESELKRAQVQFNNFVSTNGRPPPLPPAHIAVPYNSQSVGNNGQSATVNGQQPAIINIHPATFTDQGPSTNTGFMYEQMPANPLLLSRSTIPMATTTGSNLTPPITMPPPRKLLDLPMFAGQPEDWPVFQASFLESTAIYNYTNFENHQRLTKCLRGEARESVKSLLIHPNNGNDVIEQLRFRFGRPEQLVRSQLKIVKDMPSISEAAIGKLVPFATVTKNLTVFLQSIGEERHLVNPTLLEELVAKLPLSKRVDWARQSASIQPYPTIAHFSEWLTEMARFVQLVQVQEDPKRRAVLHAATRQSTVKCTICQGDHAALECRQLLDATVSDRWKVVKRLRLCFSCFWPGHFTRDCRRRKVCPVSECSKYHNRILHEGAAVQPTKPLAAAEPPSCHNPVLSCSRRPSGDFLFRVVPVTLYGPNKRINTYALLDEGSSIKMMDDSLVQELGLKSQQCQMEIQWFGGRAAKETVAVANLYVSGLGLKKRHMLRNVHGVANLNLPMQSLSHRDISNVVRYQSKMPVQPYENAKPKILIELDHCHLGLPTKTMTFNSKGPYAAVTKLGCVIFGPLSNLPPRKPSCLHINTRESQLENLIKNYFSEESFGVRAAPPVESASDMRAKHILESTTIKLDGRYQTGLLWKSDNVSLPESHTMAMKRLVGIERKMDRCEEFGKAYSDIVNAYINKGYARKLSRKEVQEQASRNWFLPHFAVENPQKPGKLRLVFDAAAMSHGVSLNSQLLKGPQHYRPLVSVLFHFREGMIAVCADIKEMFHQVVISPEDRCAQRFLWRNGDPKQPPDVYEMVAMTFGAACSPCSAHFVKERNALEHRSHDPRAVQAITDYHYVDDYVDSFCSVSKAIEISKQVRAIHKDAGFELRKFKSNSPEVVDALGGENTELSITAKEGTEFEKILGMAWQPSNDYFTHNLNFPKIDSSIINGERVPTKRTLLSIIMSIFDPLGLLSHFTVTAKLVMREIWKRDLGWDEPVPADINIMWNTFRMQLLNIMECQVPRHYFRLGAPKSLELHIFVDASEDAFGAVAYWRTETETNAVEIALVFAKTRSAPLKLLTIPRLELQAAVLGTRMMTTIVKEHEVHVNRCILWSDSRTVLKWIASEHCRYKPFVAHRIAEILNVSKPSNWRWVPTKENVADDATRFNKDASLSPTCRWFSGPVFLSQPEYLWPADIADIDCGEEKEELRPKFVLMIANNCLIEFERFSSFNRLKRTLAWVFRFVKNCKLKVKHIAGPANAGLVSSELQSAERFLCRRVQRKIFCNEVIQLGKGLVVSKDSPLYTLGPFIDNDGVIRACGRLDDVSWIAYGARRSIILPPQHTFTKLIVAHEHSQMMHQNIEATICRIRQRYWIPNLRKVIRGVISRCNVCKIRDAKPVAPQMGLLPEDRVTPYVRPFTYTGLDYFGPVNVTVGRRTEKRWVALFTCLTIRAIHLEMAHDLSTDACILALRNFMNRRGVPRRIRSDNGKNFVGVAGEMRRFSVNAQSKVVFADGDAKRRGRRVHMRCEDAEKEVATRPGGESLSWKRWPSSSGGCADFYRCGSASCF